MNKLLQLTGWAFVVLTMVFNTNAVQAGTCVSSGQVYDGNGGPWTLAGSPYILMGTNITVPDGKTLTIQPGVTVLMNNQGGTAFIQVAGALIARGVTFTGLGQFKRDPVTGACSGEESRVPGTWGFMSFTDPDPGSLLENCRITYGGVMITVGGSNVVKNSNLTIKDCFIGFSAGNGVQLGNAASPIITGTTFQGNAYAGLYESSLDAPVVDGCAFIGNGSLGSELFPYPLVVYADNVKNYTNLFISGNVVDAIWVWGEPVSTGTWKDHGVPYHLVGVYNVNVTVQDGDTLTLEPGVDIRFGRNLGLMVPGTLVADGDSCRRITFDKIDTSATATWGSIRLSSSDPGTILDYCDISNAGVALSLSNVGSNVTISNCRITNSSGIGINVSGNSSPLISNNLISGNKSSGVNVTTSAGFAPIFRYNLITNNSEGIRNGSGIGNQIVNLGTAVDPGHNAFVNNTGFELYNLSSAAISAIGNYWVDTDSAVIDQRHIFDNDENTASGRVILNPVDLTDQSRPPQNRLCAPPCAALSVTITGPTAAPIYQTASRYLALSGTAVDDRGVAGITWKNLTTGVSGAAMLGASRRNVTWNVPNILLNPGQNSITVTANDGDGCTTGDQITVTFVGAAGCWEDDSFDNLNLGSLNGQNGWATVPGRAAVSVITDTTATGKVLLMDAPANSVAIMEKDVPDQANGMHSLELLVRVEPSDTSMAKIEVKTTGNPRWDKKFQLYFGTHMRLNYGPTQPEAIIFLPRVEAQRWYHVRAEIDLDKNLVDLFLDGAQILNDVVIGPGPITQLSISAFDYPGSVIFDDIRGCPITVNQPPIVWPGDTNNDGVVNQADILPIGLHWSRTGPRRSNASIFWSGQPSPAWTPLAATYANANGDTVINQADVLPIGLNWAKTHTGNFVRAVAKSEQANAVGSAGLKPEVNPPQPSPGQEFFIRIKAAEVTDLFGLSFELLYDRRNLLQILAVEPDSLMGNDVIFFSQVDTAAGKVSVGLSRKAGQPGVNGNGAAVRVKVKLSPAARPGDAINLTLQNVAANNSTGAPISLTVGSARISVVTTAVDDEHETKVIADYRLEQNYPNPFNPGTLIKYEIPQTGQVVVKVYNALGQEVRTLVNKVQQPGRYQINWNGRDERGDVVPSGIYFYRLEAGSFVQIRKMTLLR